MSRVTLLPSYPAPDWDELERVLVALQGQATDFQIDIVDGRFVPHLSWPFNETDLDTALAKLDAWRSAYILEFDCMVLHPEQYLDRLVQAGAQRIIIHYGSTDAYADIAQHSQTHDYQLGLAVTVDIPMEQIVPLLPYVSYVQVMGIAKVGQQGQPFAVEALERIRELKAHAPNLVVAVDGSVNADTIPDLVAAGADRLAPGSAITKQADPRAAYKQLQDLLVE